MFGFSSMDAFKLWRFVAIGCFVLLYFVACNKEQEPVVAVNFISATPSEVTLAPNQDTTVAISNGTPPYTLLQGPKANVASASLDGTVLSIHGVGMGGSSATVGDNASPQNTVRISIVVSASSTYPSH